METKERKRGTKGDRRNNINSIDYNNNSNVNISSSNSANSSR